MRVDLLCSGSKGNSCLVRTNKASILIDCGPATRRYQINAMKEAGCTPDDIDALFITHRHSDHIRQLKCFKDRPIYAPCPLCITNTKKEVIPLDLHPFLPGDTKQIGDLHILALCLSHDAGETIGFVIERYAESNADENSFDDNEAQPEVLEKLVYITDTGYINSSLMPLIMDADYYIMESNHDVRMLMESSRPMALKQRILSDVGHLSNEMSSWILSHCVSLRTKEIILAHISEETNTPQKALDCLLDRFEQCSIDCSNINIRAALQFEPIGFGSLDSQNGRAGEIAASDSAFNEEKKDESLMQETLNLEPLNLNEQANAAADLQIRCMRQNELDLAETIYKTLCEQTAKEKYNPLWRYGIYPTRADLEQALENGELYLGSLQDKPAVIMRLCQESEDKALSLHLFGVLKAYRGLRLSTAMLLYMEQTARELGLKKLTLNVIDGNERAARVYEKFGFVYSRRSSEMENGETLYFTDYEKCL